MKLDYDTKTISIPRSKTKLILLFCIALVFGAAGFWFVKDPLQFANDSFNHRPTFVVLLIGIISIVFSIAGILAFGFQFFSHFPGLIVDDDGITIIGLSSRNVDWGDMSKFDIKEISRTRLISIYLSDTEAYINRDPRKWQRMLMQFSYKKYGAPLSLTTNNLDCDFDDLYDLLTTRLKEYNEAEKVTHFKGV